MRHAGDVSTGPTQAGDEPVAHRVAGIHHDDGYARGGLHGSLHGGRAEGDDDVDVAPHELGGQLGKPPGVTVCAESVFDDVVSDYPAVLS